MSDTSDKKYETAAAYENPANVSLSNSLKAVEEYELATEIPNDTRQLRMINRFNYPVSGSMKMRSYVFMTRPNLNLFEPETDTLSGYSMPQFGENMHPALKSLPTYSYIYNLGRDEYNGGSDWLGKNIFNSLEEFGTSKGKYRASPWLSIATNCARSYDVIDMDTDSVDVGETFHGNKISYAEPTFKHLIGGDISIQFNDRRDLSMYYTLLLWSQYIHDVTLGYHCPLKKYIGTGVLDYAVSLYYVVVDETMENVIYWEKLTGVYPTKVPSNIFSKEDSATAKQFSYTIDFKYSMRSDPNDVTSLMEMNALYGIFGDDDRFNTDENGKWRVGDPGGRFQTLKEYIKNIETSNLCTNASNSGGTGKEDYSKVISDVQEFYGKAAPSNAALNKQYNVGQSSACYIITPNGGKTGEVSAFYPNYLVNENMNGIPYVNGPFITLGSSIQVKDSDSLEQAKKQAELNKGQYKLRWI